MKTLGDPCPDIREGAGFQSYCREVLKVIGKFSACVVENKPKLSYASLKRRLKEAGLDHEDYQLSMALMDLETDREITVDTSNPLLTYIHLGSTRPNVSTETGTWLGSNGGRGR